MSTVTDVLKNEVSHIGNLVHQIGDSPLKSAAQFGLGAADPFSARMWSGVTGSHFTPLVGQMGGETNAQYAQSDAQGVNTGTSRMLGHVADAVSAIWGAYGLASGGAGAAAGLGGGTAGGAGAGAEAGVDSGSVNLFADAVPGAGGDVGASVGGAGGAAAGGGGSMLGNLTLAQKAELAMSAASLAKNAMAPGAKVGTAAPVAQLPQAPESQGGSAAQAMMSGTGQAGGAPGVAQTLLTGAGGIDPSTIGLGKNTLLGS